jgi:hypothetical protein
MESATTFFGCPNLWKACIFAALDSLGRVWWNSVHNIQELNYAQLRNNFLERWCPESILQPTLKAYANKRVQGKDETISEFAESFILLINQLEPKPSERRAIIMFEDKIHKEVAAALAGDRFATLQEAIDKARIVEEKMMRRDARPSYAFLKGLEPNSKIQTFEA